MNKKMIEFNSSQRNKKLPDLKAGDVVKVYRKIKEGEKERTQAFEGIILAVKGKQSSSPTITVRKVSYGVGVELVLPVFSPQIEKIEVIKRAKVKRSKLYYVREKTAKSLRLKYEDAPEEVLKDVLEEKEETTEKPEEPKEEVKTEEKKEEKAEESKASEEAKAEPKEGKKEEK